MKTATDRERGFALLIVLWALGLLALLGTAVGAAGRNAMTLTQNLRAAGIVEAATEGAIQQEIFDLLTSGAADAIAAGFVRRMRIGTTAVTVSVADEDGRMNLNLAQAPQLAALLGEVGAPPAVAASVAAAILDWRTDGTVPRPGGAKTPQYRAAGRPYASPGVPFGSVDELGQVLGVTPALLQQVRPHVTVLTDYEPVDQSADPVVARALRQTARPGLPPQSIDLGALAVARITATGRGPNGATVMLRAVVQLNGASSGMPFRILSWVREPGE